jgi:uncharacterized protein (TIGR02270 family)
MMRATALPGGARPAAVPEGEALSTLGRPPVLLDVVEEHFEELDFLWELREGVIFAPDWNLEDLAELEERAEAHLDGLRLAEAHAVDIARPALTGGETFAATAATFVFMETGVPELAEEVVMAFRSAEAPAREGIRIGLRHSRIAPVAESLTALAASGEAGLRAAAADVLAFHRLPVPEIRDLLADEDDAVRILAYGALGRGGAPLDPDAVNAGLESKAPAVRRAALEAAARSGTPGLDAICRQAASRPADPDPEALAFLGVLGHPQDLALLQEAVQRPELAPAAIRGLGALGRVEAIPLLIQLMENPELAPAAGAAFQRITGAEDLEGERPAPPPPDTTDIEAEFADEAPPPDPAKAQAWWQAHQGALDPAARWQAGRDLGTDPLAAGFEALPLAVRRDSLLGARSRGAASDLELERRAALQR